MKQKVSLNPKQEKIAVYMFISTFCLIGVATMYFFYIHFAIKNYYVRLSWEKVPCTLLSVGIESNRGRRSVGKGGSRRSSGTRTVVGQYTYQFDGKTYESDCLNFSLNGVAFESIVSSSYKKYKKMSDPYCYVNPQEPSEAVLDPTLFSGSYLPLGVGATFVVFSGLMLRQYRGMVKQQAKR